MSVLETCNDIIKDITKLKIDSEQQYHSALGIKKYKNEDNLNITKERKWSMRDMQLSNDAIPIPTSPRNNKQFRITYLRTVIKYLDYESIFNLSLVNKEFYSFLTSIYYYKFISQVKGKHKKNEKSVELNSSFSSNNSLFSNKKKGGGGFFSALTGALSLFAPVTDNSSKKEVKIDMKEIKTRIELHEKVLNEKLRNIHISKEIIDIRTNIDKLIEERYKNKGESSDDKEIEKIKREKIEATYLELKKEVEALNDESIKLKNRYEILQKQDIDKEMKMNMIGNYIKNNFNVNCIKS